MFSGFYLDIEKASVPAKCLQPIIIIICNFEGRMLKHINDVNMRVGSSNNILIATLRENCFIYAGPLGQKLVRTVHSVYNNY